MNMPADRLRWFRTLAWSQQQPRKAAQNRRQDQEHATHYDSASDTPVRWQLQPGFYVQGLSDHCPGVLLRSLEAGDLLEMVPESCAADCQAEHSSDRSAVRLEFGLFHVGYVPHSASQLLYRLLRQGRSITARVGKLDLTAPLERALWIEACLLE